MTRLFWFFQKKCRVAQSRSNFSAKERQGIIGNKLNMLKIESLSGGDILTRISLYKPDCLVASDRLKNLIQG
jgi:hypothetical protein